MGLGVHMLFSNQYAEKAVNLVNANCIGPAQVYAMLCVAASIKEAAQGLQVHDGT